MLITAYLKIGMRMSIENVSITMREMFGITISEGEAQDILYQLSDALGMEYPSLLDDIRKAPLRHIDTTTFLENGSNTDLGSSLLGKRRYFIPPGATTTMLPWKF
jgi:hypothetical protein